jgi:hypothetical protein
MAHTPGPWTYEVEKASGPSLSDATYLFAHGDVLGKVYEIATQGNSQANARLCAAAPDLLEALRECSVRLDACRMVIADADAREMVRASVMKARAAIARAAQ